MKNSKMVTTMLLLGLVACQNNNDQADLIPKTTVIRKSTPGTLEIYKPNVDGVMVEFKSKDKLISFSKKDKEYSIGDMIFSSKQVEAFRREFSSEKGARTGLLNNSDYWPGGVVAYTINGGLPNQGRVIDAINHWQNTTRIRFVLRTNQADYIEFVQSDGCSSFVGRQGGRQIINLADGCSVGNTIHEIGHALGLFHEQSRTDRNNFITINTGNVIPGLENNFTTYTDMGRSGFQFDVLDFNSIMLYGSFDFSRNGLPTITRTDGSIYTVQRDNLSGGDIDAINRMYFGIRASVFYQIAEDNSSPDVSGSGGQTNDVLYNVYVRFFADDQSTVPITPNSQILVNGTISNVNGTGQNSNFVVNVPAGNQTYFLCQSRNLCQYNSYGEVSGPCYSENVIINNSPEKAYIRPYGN